MSFQLVPQLFVYIIYIPGFIFTIIIAFILRKYLKFGAFYQILLVSGLLDISHYALFIWLHWIEICYPGQLYIDTGYYWVTIDLILSFTHFLYNLLLAINRFSATFISSSKFWSAKLVRVYIIVMFIIALVSCTPTYLDTKEDVIKLTNISDYQAIQRLILSGIVLTCDIPSIILTILTIYRIRFFETAHEKKLIIVTASHTVIAIVAFLYEVTKTLELQDPISLFLAEYRTILAVIFICSNLATILIADLRVRQDFIAIFRIRGNSIFVVSVWSSENH